MCHYQSIFAVWDSSMNLAGSFIDATQALLRHGWVISALVCTPLCTPSSHAGHSVSENWRERSTVLVYVLSVGGSACDVDSYLSCQFHQPSEVPHWCRFHAAGECSPPTLVPPQWGGFVLVQALPSCARHTYIFLSVTFPWTGDCTSSQIPAASIELTQGMWWGYEYRDYRRY